MPMRTTGYDRTAFFRQMEAHAESLVTLAGDARWIVTSLAPDPQDETFDDNAHTHAPECIAALAKQLRAKADTLDEMQRYSMYPPARFQEVEFLFDKDGHPLRGREVLNTYKVISDAMVLVWANEDILIPELIVQPQFRGQVQLLMYSIDGLYIGGAQEQFIIDDLSNRILARRQEQGRYRTA